MATELLSTYKREISQLTLIPSDGGRFEFSKNGNLLYSKLQTGEFPSHEKIHQLLKQKQPV